MVKNIKTRATSLLIAIATFVLALTFVAPKTAQASESAAQPTSTTTLSAEVAKVAYTPEELAASGLTESSFTTAGAMLNVSDALKTLYANAFAKSSLKYYVSTFFYGSVHNHEYYTWLNEAERWPVSYTAVNGLSAGLWIGSGLGFKPNGECAIGVSEETYAVWAIGWTAPEDGTLTIPQTQLTINSAVNAKLKMAWTVGSHMQAKSTDGWTEYAQSTVIEEKSFNVTKGDVVYISMFADGTGNDHSVNVTYDPTFNFYQKAEEPDDGKTVTTSLKSEIAKIQSGETMATDTVLDFYGSVKWLGYAQKNYASMYGDPNAGAFSYSSINGFAPMNPGNNTAFRNNGTYTVGRLGGDGQDRMWAIAYTATTHGKVVIPSKTLVVAAASIGLNYEATYNASLKMSVTKGTADRAEMKPSDENMNWNTYEAGQTYTIPEQSFTVAAGDVIYVNLYAAKDNGTEDELERCVTFTYDLIFKETPCEYNTFDKQVTTDEYKATDATCTAKATYYYSCECGLKGSETFEYGETLEHVYDKQAATDDYKATDATCTAKATYYYSCECGKVGSETFEYGEKANHSFGEWVIVKEATETETGLKERTCVCGEKETEVIPMLTTESGSSESSSGSADNAATEGGCYGSVSGSAFAFVLSLFGVATLIKKRKNQ